MQPQSMRVVRDTRGRFYCSRAEFHARIRQLRVEAGAQPLVRSAPTIPTRQSQPLVSARGEAYWLAAMGVVAILLVVGSVLGLLS